MRCEPIDARPSARPSTGNLACRVCGCTEERACVTDAGPCSWVSMEPPLCSACFTPGDLADAAIDDSAFFGDERCPASRTPAAHVPLFTSETEWHCVNCQLAFFT